MPKVAGATASCSAYLSLRAVQLVLTLEVDSWPATPLAMFPVSHLWRDECARVLTLDCIILAETWFQSKVALFCSVLLSFCFFVFLCLFFFPFSFFFRCFSLHLPVCFVFVCLFVCWLVGWLVGLFVVLLFACLLACLLIAYFLSVFPQNVSWFVCKRN